MKGARLVVAFAVFLCAACWPMLCSGERLTPGNIIVSNSPFTEPPKFFEFTTSGTLVQELTLSDRGLGNSPRDLVLDNNGNVQFYGGTFNPELITYDPSADVITTTPNFPGWSTVNNLTYGGMAALGDYVYATDMSTANNGSPDGIVRFDIDDLSATRFDAGDIIDINAGLDGLLYTLPVSNAGANTVNVYDPTDMTLIRSVSIGGSYRAVAVDEDGNLYAAGSNSASSGGTAGVFQFSPDGTLLNQLDDPGIGGFADIDINSDGELLVASHGGVLMLTDTSLSSSTSFNTRTSNGWNFAAFVQPVTRPSSGPGPSPTPQPGPGPPPPVDVDECIAEITALADQYETDTAAALPAMVTEIQTLTDAGDRAGAGSAFNSNRLTVVRAGRQVMQEILRHCAQCRQQLRSQPEDIGRLSDACIAARDRAGQTQSNAVDQMEAARFANGVPSTANSLAQRSLRFADWTARNFENAQRRTSRNVARMVEQNVAAGNSERANALADHASGTRQRVRDAAVARIERVRIATDSRLGTWSGTDDLISQVDAAATGAVARIDAAAAAADATINDALSGG